MKGKEPLYKASFAEQSKTGGWFEGIECPDGWHIMEVFRDGSITVLNAGENSKKELRATLKILNRNKDVPEGHDVTGVL